MNLQYWKNALFCCCLFAITACSDEETVNPPAPTEIPEQPAELAEQLAQYNSDIAALQLMVDGKWKWWIIPRMNNITIRWS